MIAMMGTMDRKSPCYRCRHRQRCTDFELLCSRFLCWSNGDPWKDKPTDPSPELYDRLYNDDEAA